jgi:hypothetical protein
MTRTVPSTTESDELAYGETGAARVGWYIYAPPSRNAAVARLLELSSVYCVGIDRETGRAFIQTDRSIDPRNGKLKYVEAAPELAAAVKDILEGRSLTVAEMQEATRHLDAQMELARKGLL